jgi:acyl carrier protein
MDVGIKGLNMTVVATNIQHRILTLVKTILQHNAVDSELLPESRLVDVGLTSMDMVKLMLSVEAEFDLTLPQSEITPDNFRSVRMIEQMIDKQLQLRLQLS